MNMHNSSKVTESQCGSSRKCFLVLFSLVYPPDVFVKVIAFSKAFWALKTYERLFTCVGSHMSSEFIWSYKSLFTGGPAANKWPFPIMPVQMGSQTRDFDINLLTRMNMAVACLFEETTLSDHWSTTLGINTHPSQRMILKQDKIVGNVFTIECSYLSLPTARDKAQCRWPWGSVEPVE